jgi:hypothetical protein
MRSRDPHRRETRWLTGFFALAAMLSAMLLPAAAQAAFGLKNAEVKFSEQGDAPVTEAGAHPYSMTTRIDMNTIVDPDLGEIPDGALKAIEVDLPPGMAGDPTAVPRCPDAVFVLVPQNSYSACPDETAVGVVLLRLGPGEGGEPFPVFNLEPSPGFVARFGFIGFGVPVTIDIGIRERAPYNVYASLNGVPQPVAFHGSDLTIWGNPADPSHDAERGGCLELVTGPPIRTNCEVDIPEKPLLTLPRSCRGPLVTTFQAEAWESLGSGSRVTKTTSSPQLDDCGSLEFEPTIAARPTSDQAESPTGLDFSLQVRDKGLTDPTKRAQTDIERAVVTLPEGMTADPSAANGLAACGKAGFENETLTSEPGEGCPEASKLGKVEVETPLLEGKLLRGSVYLAQQDDPATPAPGSENPFDSFLAIYMVIKDRDLGILVKLPGRVTPDGKSGRLTTTFGESPLEIPQFPVSDFRFHFFGGPRGPLVTPPACGDFVIDARFTPWANPGSVSAQTSQFPISKGIGGGPCPSGAPPFRPGFAAGTVDNAAGSYSPLEVRLTREDGDQELTRFSSILPPGVSANLSGVAKCSDAAIAAAGLKPGKAELANLSCPPSSKVGRSLAGAGVGPVLTFVPGSLYLAGPFAGAPLSIVAITPAVAGPFDAGTVVIREAVNVDPVTTEVKVESTDSGLIPHVVKGIPLKLRDLRIFVDRGHFTLNATSCDPSSTRATLFSSFFNLLSPVDDVASALQSRYQAAGCERLGFKPRLRLELKGGTRRAKFPALKATLTARPGDANIGKAVVTLPHSMFLEQGHIGTVCTRVQFAAEQCPKGSIYGKARAVTPLLDEPLEGPVYLRSSSHRLPDLAVSLRGIVDIEVSGRIDSAKGRLRTNFETIPDQPITKFVLEMRGGKKGLLTNSRNLCGGPNRALATFTGQNNKLSPQAPVMKVRNCKHKHR